MKDYIGSREVASAFEQVPEAPVQQYSLHQLLSPQDGKHSTLTLNLEDILGDRCWCVMRRPRTESEHAPHYSDDRLLIVDHGDLCDPSTGSC